MQSIDLSVDPILLSKVREKFLADYKLHKDLYDECDVEKVRESVWTVKRFLITCKSDVDQTFVMLRDCMRWRKSFGINTRTDLDYPKEFYQAGAFFPYCGDIDDKVVIYMRIKLYRKFPKYSDYLKEYFIHTINKIDEKVCESGLYLIFW